MSWPMVELGDLARVLGGYAFKSSDFSDKGSPIVRISNLESGGLNLNSCARIPVSKVGKGIKYTLRPGDILIAMSGATTGKVGLVPFGISEQLLLNQRVGAFRIKDEQLIEQGYLHRIICSSSYQKHLWGLAAGAAQPNVSAKQLESIQIPLPPLPEQKRIAKILDQADALRAKRREAIAKLDPFLQSTFLDMFGDPVTNPKGWEVKTLGELIVTKPNNGIFRKNHDYLQNDKEGIPVVWVEELFRGAEIDTSCSRRLHATQKEIQKYGLKTGDILFCRSSLKLGGIGYNNLFRGKSDEALFECHLIRISPLKKIISPVFLNFQLHTKAMRAVLISKSKTSTMTTIDQKALASVKVVVPSMDLQNKFASTVDKVKEQRNRMLNQSTQLDTLFSSLQSKAFSGEL